MKRRTYKTLDGGTVVALRPETAAELAALEANENDQDGTELDSRHSLGDEREELPEDVPA